MPIPREIILTKTSLMTMTVGPISVWAFHCLPYTHPNGVPVDDYARTLEEQWIDSLDNGGGGPLSQSSSLSTATIMNGVIVGFLFPLMPFFFSGTQKTASFWEDGTAHENQGGIVFS